MTTAQYISDYLRDAQYRIAQLGIEIDNKRDEGEEDPLFALLREKRKALIDFMEIVYDPYHLYQDGGYNFLAAPTAWTDREIAAEVEYLRDFADMTRIPYGVFTGYYPTIVNNILGDGFGANNSAVFPEGDYLDILRYNASGQLEAIPFPQYTGMGNLSINDYFTGRL
jgi:hypothetical protein